jgi:hypothetical protein
MWATVIPKYTAPNIDPDTATGYYETYQDEDSGEILTRLVANPGNPATAKDGTPYTIQCYARAYTALGYRSSANTERMVQGDFSMAESIQFDFPSSVRLTRQTLVTKIRPSRLDDGLTYFWLNEDTGNPTVWQVQGVSPVHDPFGKHIRNTTVLKRAEVQ